MRDDRVFSSVTGRTSSPWPFAVQHGAKKAGKTPRSCRTAVLRRVFVRSVDVLAFCSGTTGRMDYGDVANQINATRVVQSDNFISKVPK
jgi:hypothetical protein